MLNRRTRGLIEWHFRNYKADKQLYEDYVKDVAESGITQSFSRVGNETVGWEPAIKGKSWKMSNPTEDKALLLCKLGNPVLWARVIENVMVAFEFETQADIIQDKFNPQKRIKYVELIKKHGNGNRSVYDYRYSKIIELAAAWAQKYGLII